MLVLKGSLMKPVEVSDQACLSPTKNVEVSDRECQSPMGLRSGMSVSNGSPMKHVEVFDVFPIRHVGLR